MLPFPFFAESTFVKNQFDEQNKAFDQMGADPLYRNARLPRNSAGAGNPPKAKPE